MSRRINELQELKSSLQSKLVVEKNKASNSSTYHSRKEAIEDILNSEHSLIDSLGN